jgi:hypothetical protein
LQKLVLCLDKGEFIEKGEELLEGKDSSKLHMELEEDFKIERYC